MPTCGAGGRSLSVVESPDLCLSIDLVQSFDFLGEDCQDFLGLLWRSDSPKRLVSGEQIILCIVHLCTICLATTEERALDRTAKRIGDCSCLLNFFLLKIFFFFLFFLFFLFFVFLSNQIFPEQLVRADGPPTCSNSESVQSVVWVFYKDVLVEAATPQSQRTQMGAYMTVGPGCAGARQILQIHLVQVVRALALGVFIDVDIVADALGLRLDRLEQFDVPLAGSAYREHGRPDNAEMEEDPTERGQ